MPTKQQKHASELMPQDADALRILKARAELLAQPEVSPVDVRGVDYVRFQLSPREQYGISYQNVEEILNHITVSKPPCIPNFVAGVINWRGSLITVVDLMKFFHPEYSGPAAAFIIIVSVEDMTLGILAYSIEGSLMYQPNQLSMPLSSTKVANPDYILGLHQSVTAILNVDVLMPGLYQAIKEGIYRIGDVHEE
ncbi:chemotaxis protein CheW [Legionella lytica]|uniref:Chemotaxis protein CheW n=1 Tax=Legionella lytica TaxID=96232 RepID=A0ABW8D5R4_9GAMM